MSHSYPRFGGVSKQYKRPDKNLQCSACDAPASEKIEIQFGYMRGSDDEFYFTCCNHQNLAQDKTLQYLELCEAKYRKIQEKKAAKLAGGHAEF